MEKIGKAKPLHLINKHMQYEKVRGCLAIHRKVGVGAAIGLLQCAEALREQFTAPDSADLAVYWGRVAALLIHPVQEFVLVDENSSTDTADCNCQPVPG